jgi:hypothetical protein
VKEEGGEEGEEVATSLGEGTCEVDDCRHVEVRDAVIRRIS